ncbi:SURF1 family protein [Planctomonas sp. JC2975]|uniref:SURF1 family protein n=1 Tax=Planctomonas sp. JC2975 TaxID=2729626 RepID=UPI001475693B|nr:SURF1 family cytochrome oxidase biogenesis protein [Planctomonas sp. JC2975]NNC11791.1 SURF1 family protein [Planctomonas sp. JC2975]
MVRPKWIAALLLALVIAGAFAWLGQWQLERAVESGHVVEHPTETVKPLNEIATVNSPPTTAGVGQLVTSRGTFSATDYGILVGRLNDGAAGYWVIARFTPAADDADGKTAQLAVARGWAPTEQKAKAAIAQLRNQPETPVTLTGRLLPSEAPEAPKENTDPFAMKDMAVAALVNTWHGIGDSDVYSSYLVEHGTPPAGLTAIYSPPPIEQATVNWLNIFYAAEWAIFAGFAIFLWYRVVKDAWEKQREDAETAYEAALAAWRGEPVGQPATGGTETEQN